MKTVIEVESREQLKFIPGVTFFTMRREKGNTFSPDEFKCVMQGTFDFSFPHETIGFTSSTEFIKFLKDEGYSLSAFKSSALNEIYEVLDKLYEEVIKY